MDCLFCRIVRKEIPSRFLYANDHIVAFLDVHPSTDGHTLVIPRMHASTLLDVREDVMPYVWSGVQAVIALLRDHLGAKSFTIGINHGKISGQVVEHLHIHIIPRYEYDGGSSIQSVVHSPSQLTIDEIYNKIIN